MCTGLEGPRPTPSTPRNLPYCPASLQLCPLFASQWIVAHKAPLSMGFYRQEYWNGLPCSLPGDLPHPGIEPRSPPLQADSLPSEPLGKHNRNRISSCIGCVNCAFSFVREVSKLITYLTKTWYESPHFMGGEQVKKQEITCPGPHIDVIVGQR